MRNNESQFRLIFMVASREVEFVPARGLVAYCIITKNRLQIKSFLRKYNEKLN